MVTIKHGLGTKLGVGVSILTLLPPIITEVIALVENVSTHWTNAEKTSLITGAVVAFATMGGKFAQAVAAILKGSTNV